jgi:hypothetical protein
VENHKEVLIFWNIKFKNISLKKFPSTVMQTKKTWFLHFHCQNEIVICTFKLLFLVKLLNHHPTCCQFWNLIPSLKPIFNKPSLLSKLVWIKSSLGPSFQNPSLFVIVKICKPQAPNVQELGVSATFTIHYSMLNVHSWMIESQSDTCSLKSFKIVAIASLLNARWNGKVVAQHSNFN